MTVESGKNPQLRISPQQKMFNSGYRISMTQFEFKFIIPSILSITILLPGLSVKGLFNLESK